MTTTADGQDLAKRLRTCAEFFASDYGYVLATTCEEAAAFIERSCNTAAARDVLAERQRQVEAEGWTPAHDDKHRSGELANAAACYALIPHRPAMPRSELTKESVESIVNRVWPWWNEYDNGDRLYSLTKAWWKPTDRRRDLVKAAALILAEIERLDRKEASNG